MRNITDEYFSELISRGVCKRISSDYGDHFCIKQDAGKGYFKRMCFSDGLEVSMMNLETFKTFDNMTFKCPNEYLEIGYVKKGSVVMSVDKASKIFRVSEGEIFIYRMKNDINAFSIGISDCSSLSIKISPEIFLYSLGSDKTGAGEEIWYNMMDQFFKPEVLLTLKATDEIKDIYDGLETLSLEEPFGVITYKSKILEMSYKIIERFKTFESENDIKVFAELTSYIYRNLGGNLQLEDLSDEFDLSIYQIQKLFKDHKECTAYQFIRKCRLNYASILLLETRKSILEIANDCGYENPSKFSCAFKNEFNCTPLKFRKLKMP